VAEPLPICYLNGEFVPFEAARISPFDRGFLFGDGAYEVMPVYRRPPVSRRRALRAPDAQSRRHAHGGSAQRCRVARALCGAHRQERRRGSVPLLAGHARRRTRPQSRAAAARSRAPCSSSAHRSCCRAAAVRERGVACISAADTRWARCDIKSTALLANVLLRELSVEANAAETILLRDGHLTEGSSSAVHIVAGWAAAHSGALARRFCRARRAASSKSWQRAAGVVHRAGPVSEHELRGADEIWLSSAAREILPVTTLDGARRSAAGKPGPCGGASMPSCSSTRLELAQVPW
jgi:D-alanine transaminase